MLHTKVQKKIRFVVFRSGIEEKRSRTKLAPKKVYFHHFAKSNCSFFRTATECVKRFVPLGPRPLDGRKSRQMRFFRSKWICTDSVFGF